MAWIITPVGEAPPEARLFTAAVTRYSGRSSNPGTFPAAVRTSLLPFSGRAALLPAADRTDLLPVSDRADLLPASIGTTQQSAP